MRADRPRLSSDRRDHHYSALLLLPLCLLWRERERFGNTRIAIAVIGALAWLASRGSNALFATTPLTWLAMAALSLRTPAPARLAQAAI